MEKQQFESIVSGDDQILTAEQAAEFTHYRLSWIYQLVHRRAVPCYKKGARLFFLKSELAAWLLQGRRLTQAELEVEAEARMVR